MRIIEEEQTRDGNIKQKLEKYREAFEDAILDGEIKEHERAALQSLQKSLSLTDEEVKEVEEQWTKAKYREEFALAVDDATITVSERKHLNHLKQVLNLNDKQTNEIEKDFSFKEEISDG